MMAVATIRAVNGQILKTRRLLTEMLDSFFDEILKEAKKKKVNEKKNAGKPCSNEFLNFQRDQFSHQM